jgi:hypothetical protein
MRSDLLILALRCSLRVRGGGTSSESEARLRLHHGSKAHTDTKAETKGYARAFRRAFDLQPKDRSGSAA